MIDPTAVPPSDETLESRIAALTPMQRRALDQIMTKKGHHDSLGIVRRPNPAGECPVSFEQERLWYMNELVAYRTIFHVPLALRLRGEVNLDAYRRAVDALIARHQTLRTVFRKGPDGLHQVVLDRMAVDTDIVDCREAADPVGDARRRGSASVFEPFDLANGPLIRLTLYQVGSDDHVLVLVQHHIITDYWSLGILLTELGALYSSELDANDTLTPLDLHYPDFAYWQRSTTNRAVIDQHLAYWREQLEDAPDVLELPTDRPRPVARRSQGSFHHVEFGADAVERLSALVSGHSTTLLVGFLSTYVALLARLTRQDEVVVGVPIAGRSRPEVQDMLGYFLNWLPIRVSVAGRPSFHQLVKRTATAFAEAMTHQDVPFEMLVQQLVQTRTPGVTPVFQTSLSLRDAPPEPPQLPGIEVTFTDLDGGATHFDLMAELWREDDRVVGYLPYNDELFDKATVAAYATWMTRILDLATAEPDRPLATFSLLTDTECAAVLGSPPTELEPVEQTLHHRFAQQVSRRPGAIAVSDETTRLSYRELDERANRIANVLVERQICSGHLIGLVANRTVDLVAAILGVLKCGAAYLPIDPESPAERTAIQLSKCSALLTDDEGLQAPDGQCPTIVLDWASTDLVEASPEPVAVDVPLSATAYVIYTSGSTGNPKGVVVTHANVSRLLTAAQRRFDLSEDDVWTLFHSPAFDFSVWELWGPLLLGGRVVVVSDWVIRAPDAFWELVQREHVTVLSQTPSAFGPLARVAVADQRPLSLRYVVFGGEMLDFATLQDWFDVFGDERPRLINMYGITETTVHVTFRRVRSEDATSERSCIGDALDDLGLYLLDDELRPVPPGLVGELCIAGSGVAHGYLGSPALTAERMVPDPYTPIPGSRMYRSGDLAVRRRDGEVVYIGRSDDQHKIRGHRVEIGEVKAALCGLDEIEDAAVLVTRDRVGANRLVAYVVLSELATSNDHPPSGTAIRRAVLRRLPEWMAPSSVELVDALPLTRNGKLDRRALLAHLRHTNADSVPAVLPQGETAEALATIWSGILDVSTIGADDNFFDLGGHSLMVVQLVVEVRSTLDVDLAMEALFQYPELQALADAIDSDQVGTGEAESGERTEEKLASDRYLRIGSESTGDASAPTAERVAPSVVAETDIDTVRIDIARRLATIPRPRADTLPGERPLILLTGATGFVGGFVLTELLTRGHQVVCLTRSGRSALDIEHKLEELGLWHSDRAGMIEVVNGDIREPMLGVEPGRYRDLAESVGAIVNCAAAVNHIYPFDQLVQTNAHSMMPLLEVASDTITKRIIHISTTGVAESDGYPLGQVVPLSPLTALPPTSSGYRRSKAVAELYLDQASELGVSASMIRMANVFGDRSRFQVNVSDGIWNWTKAILRTGHYPQSFDADGNELLLAFTADVAAKAIADVVALDDSPGCRIVHAVPDAVIHTSDLVAAIRDAGVDAQPMADRQWYRTVSTLDVRDVWVAGIASYLAASDRVAKSRRLRRFQADGHPSIAQAIESSALHARDDLARYVQTLMNEPS